MSDPHGRRGDDSNPGINRRRWLQAIGVAGAAGMAGCTGGDGTDTATDSPTDTEGDAMGEDTPTPEGEVEIPEVGGTFNTVTSSPVDTLNPLYNTEAGAGTLIGYALDMGYTFGPGNEQIPQLYELTTDDGGKVWTGKVRENLQFGGDYGQVTAEDFVYLVQEVHKSDWAATSASSSWPETTTITQTGEFEFQIELESANLLYPATYDPLMYPIPKDLLEPYVAEEDSQGLQEDQELLELEFAGNLGAYTLDEWNRSSGQTYSRNEDYYMQEATDINQLFENAPYFETLESRVVQEQASRLGALETGETDYASIPPERVEEFDGLDNVNVYLQPQPYNEVCVYNMRENGWNAGPGNLFREKKFRQGLGCAVDKQTLVEGVFRGYANVEYTWQPRWSKWYPSDADVPEYGTGDLYGQDAAQSRIQEAIDNVEYDYSYDGQGRLLNPEGDQCTITLYHSAGQNTERSMAEFIAQEFEQNAGIVVEVNAIQGSQFSNQYWQQEIPENADELEWSNGSYNAGPRDVATSKNPWDMTVVYGLNTYPLNPLTAEVFFAKDSFYNPYGYYPSWDAPSLWEEANSAESTEELNETLSEIFVKIAEDQPMGMLAFPSSRAGYASDIVGPQENFFSGWDFPAWYREE
ncbi:MULTISPECIES: ABC transporter substrate-binding protein [Halolamina]|uniref:Peptide/nickel transport system substrate-binding protein n=1 Tax=Halolamina pelagica TaxID=699431 RepID=A0A1I5QVT5_9EURY|nr:MULTISPECIES: ABC transporter substrate-binding protein [Halolamina]NHX35568.1 ABC transporter substrate-binding protein [Halolamina sp. R1-12]SFP50404.1 peptide/nickel transport system substrate-binding protein [Halolamina pelagica]